MFCAIKYFDWLSKLRETANKLNTWNEIDMWENNTEEKCKYCNVIIISCINSISTIKWDRKIEFN